MHSVKPVAPSVCYIHSRLVRYHPCVVDLRWRRAVHSCDVCPYRNVAGPIVPGRAGPIVRCSAVHYGVCSSVKQASVVVSAPSSALNGAQATGAAPVAVVRDGSPPPPPLPAKRRINIPIIVQKQQQVTHYMSSARSHSPN